MEQNHPDMNAQAQTSTGLCNLCGAPLSRAANGSSTCLRCALDNALGPIDVEHPTDLAEKVAIAKPSDQVDGKLPRFGDYELLEEIARGGMGVVYRARQISLDRVVAVKMLPFGALASQETVQRFRIEAAAAASLQHPHIVAIYEVGFHDSQHFFAMEYVAGRSLAAIVKDGPLPPKRAAAWLKTIAEAIHYAHERNILHRDLKPSNILIDPFDQPKVTDFGLAKRLETELELTLSGQLLGSPNYMSPEQAAAKRGAVGKRSDVYALGAILYHLLTGRPPFVAPTMAETLYEVLNTEPVSPRVLNPGVPRDLETICLKCLEKESARRYESAEALAQDIGRHLNNQPVTARPPSRLYRLQKLARRNRLAFTAAGAVAAALVIGSGISSWEYLKERSARQRAVAVSDLLQQLLRSVNPDDRIGRDYTVRQMLDEFSRTSMNQFHGPPDVEASVRLAIGWTYHTLGVLSMAEPNLRRAFELRRSALGPQHLDTLEAEYQLAKFLIDTRRWEEGGRLARESWQGRLRILGAEHDDTLGSQQAYAEALSSGGDCLEAERIQLQILQIRDRVLGPDDFKTINALRNEGAMLESLGKHAEAEQYLRQAVAGFARTGLTNQTDEYFCIKELAMCRLLQGDAGEAEQLLAQVLPRCRQRLGPDDRVTLYVQRVLARALAEEGRLEEAESVCRQTLDALRRTAANQEGHSTARTLLYLGRVLVERGKFDEAEPLLQQALKLFRADEWSQPRSELAGQVENWLGAIQLTRGAYGEAEALMLPRSERFFAPEADLSPHERRLAIGHIVQIYQVSGKPDKEADWQKKLDQLPK